MVVIVMSRLNFTIVLSLGLVLFSILAGSFGNLDCDYGTWLGSFLLPLWSIGLMSIYHDFGRMAEVKMKENPFLGSLIFTLSVAFGVTVVVWVHITLMVLPLLFVLPILGFYLRDLLVHDWSNPPILKRNNLWVIFIWAISSYGTYWILTFLWIVFRVWFLDNFTDGTIYYI